MAVKALSNEVTLSPVPLDGAIVADAGGVVAEPLQAPTMIAEAATAARNVARVCMCSPPAL